MRQPQCQILALTARSVLVNGLRRGICGGVYPLNSGGAFIEDTDSEREHRPEEHYRKTGETELLSTAFDSYR
jgi:hypothetical protein